MNKIAKAGNPKFCKIFMAALLMRPIMMIGMMMWMMTLKMSDDYDEYICADDEGMEC